MFSSRSCMISGVAFQSLIYFKLIFVYGISKGPTSLFCVWIALLPSIDPEAAL